jgi:hypothetical protein
MAWEQRASGRYYYRTKRIGGRVVRQYMGTDSARFGGHVLPGMGSGWVAFEEDEQRRRKLEARRRREQRARARNDAVIERLDECLARLRKQAAEVLRSLGYHNHKGEWRKRR